MKRKTTNKKYNEAYFKSIMKFAEEYDLDGALREFSKYIQAYPKDASGYIYYADTLLKANRLEEAEAILDLIENRIHQKEFTHDLTNFGIIKSKLLLCQKKYKECYEFLTNHFPYFQKESHCAFVKRALAFLKKQLGLLTFSDCYCEDYFINQIFSYNKDKAIEHIKLHQNSLEEVQFKSDFPIELIYDLLRQKLPNEYKYIKSGFTESYIVKYDANGYCDNRLVNFIEVITLQDSSEIITMYPYENKEKRKYIDITPKREENTFTRKRMSQIDKFNQRYSKQK